MLRCVRKEGKVFFAFGSKNTSFVHIKAVHTWTEKVKIYYKVWTNLPNSTRFSNYNILYKDNARVFLEFFHSKVFGFIIIR
jgi:hypothetical protein